MNSQYTIVTATNLQSNPGGFTVNTKPMPGAKLATYIFIGDILIVVAFVLLLVLT
jgi:hypothetical protein